MSLQLIKIEEGLCSGGVIFSEYGMLIFPVNDLCEKNIIIQTESTIKL